MHSKSSPIALHSQACSHGTWKDLEVVADGSSAPRVSLCSLLILLILLWKWFRSEGTHTGFNSNLVSWTEFGVQGSQKTEWTPRDQLSFPFHLKGIQCGHTEMWAEYKCMKTTRFPSKVYSWHKLHTTADTVLDIWKYILVEAGIFWQIYSALI